MHQPSTTKIMMNDLKRMTLRTGLRRLFSALSAALLLACLALATPAGAALRFWSGAGANSQWTNPVNWGGVLPNPGDDLVFQAGAARLLNTNTFTPGMVFNSITFLGTNYVIHGNAITLAGATGLSAQHTTGTNTFHPALTLSNALSIECTAAGATLVLGTNASLNLNGFNLTNRAVGTLEISGVISGGGTVTKTGAGKLIYSGGVANANPGATLVTAGTMQLKKTAIDGAIRGPLVIGDGVNPANSAVVEVSGNEQMLDFIPVIVNAAGWLNFIGVGEFFGSLAGAGNVSVSNAMPRIGYDGTSTSFGGVISGSGGFNLVGGVLNLTGPNTYTGTTAIQGGTLLVNGSQPKSTVNITGGVLGGNGTVGNIVGAGGTVSPGSSPGTLTCSNVSATVTTFYNFELRGPAPGADYDQLNVRGTVNLTNAALSLAPNFLAPVAVGQQFILINNDGVDPVAGVFNGYPAGTSINFNGYNLVISYNGGDGNDVMLTLTSVPASVTGSTVVAGNGNGVIEASECNLIYLAITNAAGVPLTGVNATLTTTTPGVVITSMQSPYPNVAANGRGTNTIPFQLTTLPSFNCGGSIDLTLTVTTAGGSFVTTFTMSSGAVGAPVRFNNNTLTPIPDLATIESTNIVSGLGTPVKKVTVSLYLVHTFDGDLTITLLAPDGTPVELTSNNGSGGDNYGSDCADVNRTIFDDAAATSIVSGSAPFLGAYRPEGTLATFVGKSGAAANGPWRLRIKDGSAGDFGTLVCWSLFISPTACSGGGGACDLCPNVTLAGALGAGSPTQSDRLFRNGDTSSCGFVTVCPGPVGNDFGTAFDAHAFRNGPSNACITVTLTAPTADLLSAAYLGSFDPNNICLNYLADAGDSTFGINLGTGPKTYSFSVAANAVFVVTVNGIYGSTGAYQLSVTGGDCRPALNIKPATPNYVRLDWPTSAGGYLLQATPAVAPTNWTTLPLNPVVNAGRFAVTNRAANAQEFYRLLKP